MKKILFYTAALTLVLVSCAKEVEVVNNASEEEFVEVTDVMTASAPAETKTTVDGINLKWAENDAITFFDAGDDAHAFTIKTGVGETTATFEGSLGGKTACAYALYPHDDLNAKLDNEATVVYKSSYAYGTAPTPLLGTVISDNNYAFQHIGGAIRIKYRNVPSTAATFEFEESSATPNKITGQYEFSNITSGVGGTINTGASKITITGLPGTSNLEFVIPVPAGNYAFTVRLKDSDNNLIYASEKSVSSAKTVAVGHIVTLGAIILPEPVTVTKAMSDLCSDADDSKQVTPLNLNGDGIVTINQTGGGNNGKYYKSDHTLRYYNGGALVISVASGYQLQKVKITYTGTFTGLDSGVDTDASGQSVSYSATASNRISNISVTYIATSNTTESTKVSAPDVSETDNVVTITCATDEATIYYTINGDTPTTSSTVYSGPFAIDEDLTVKAIAAKVGLQNSNVGTCDCTYTALSACEAPSITCSSNKVTITTATEGASIYYTIDGSTTPTTSSTLYTAPFSIAANTTVKAIAVKLGRPNSSVTSTDCVFVSSVVVWDDDFSNNASASSTALGTFAGSKAGYISNYSSQYCYPEVSAIKLGASKNGGSITTPAFSKLTSTTNVTVTLEINGYGTDGGSLNLAVSGGGTLSASSVSATHNGETAAASVSTWDTVSVDITGATSSTTLTISCGAKKRHFINSIHIETK